MVGKVKATTEKLSDAPHCVYDCTLNLCRCRHSVKAHAKYYGCTQCRCKEFKPVKGGGQ